MEMKEKLINPCILNENAQELLLKYLQENDVEELEDLLEEGRVDVNYIYDEEASSFIYVKKTALEIACAYFGEETSEKCIQLLLDYGAEIIKTKPETETEKNAFNFAAEGKNLKILETIINHIKKKEIDVNNSNVIYSLIKYIWNSELNEEEFIPNLKLLLEPDIGININYEDTQSGWTTIYIAAKYKFKNFVQTIIDMKKSELNLDEFKDKKEKTARDLINIQDLYTGELPEYTEENSNVTVKTLYKNIRERTVVNFTENFNIIKHNLSENEKNILLNMAVIYRLEKVIKILLDHGIQYENNIEKNPMILSAQKGYYKILKMFMSTKPKGELVSEALFELLKTPYTTEQSKNINFNKCLTLLLKSEHLDINSTDFNGNTALHYALRYQDPNMALKILQKGATLASKDSFNRLAIADMDSLTLQEHLNDCIRYEYEEISTQEDACLVINFTSLLPTENSKIHYDSPKIAVDLDSQTSYDIPQTQYVPETEVLEYMCSSQELKQHLKHPVILAFLYLKWCRIAKFFYINLSLYILFVISLLSYITFGYNIKTESQHQVVTSVSYGILAFSFILLVIREISQLILNKYKYFLKFENWLEIALLIATGGILSEHSNETLMRQFSAIAIVTAAIEFLLLVGQFPAMSTNIMMLRTVSYTFFKLLLWYSILLFAFSYSFYTLFQDRGVEVPTNSTDTGEEEEQDFFEDPGMSLLKTIVMLTGEFDAASIKFNTYPVISHLIFVMFVFLIAIVLFNLLNGLAVSDTQIIKHDAELYGQILRVEHIAHIEKVLLTNIISTRILKYIPAIQKICLFPFITKKAEASYYPNQNAKIYLKDSTYKLNNDIKQDQASCFKSLFEVRLDKKIQREISQLMKDKKEEKGKLKRDVQLFTEIAEIRNLIQTLIKKQS